MADQANELRRSNWTDCCTCKEIFRTFRMAIHPPKLGLALAGLILLGLWGGFLDQIWSQKQQPVAGELNAFWQVANLHQWREGVRTAQLARVQAIYAQFGIETPTELDKRFGDDANDEIGDLQHRVMEKFRGQSKAKSDKEVADLAKSYNAAYMELDEMRSQGVFRSFMRYEQLVLHQAMKSACTLNFAGGLHEVLTARHERPTDAAAAMIVDSPVPPHAGVVTCLVLMARGKQWLLTQHFTFAILMGVVALAIWALFGGAICRIAALNVARDERISLKTALGFARRKFLGFFTAPLLPLGLILFIGVLLALGGLVMAIPGIGEIIGGLGMILALVGGFVIALVVVGYVAGSSLFYPTIAVEGSDSFDAMSRSYNYVYSRPWRAIFYGLVALVYGSLCYTFARFFVLVLLKATRFFVGVGMWGTDRPGTGYPVASKLDAMWANPTFDHLHGYPAPMGMEHWESAGAFLINIWVLLVALMLCAFLVTFYLSGSTIIYFLLRREVDATDIEDVYLDEDEEEPSAGLPAVEAPIAPVTPPQPMEPPTAEPPAGGSSA